MKHTTDDRNEIAMCSMISPRMRTAAASTSTPARRCGLRAGWFRVLVLALVAMLIGGVLVPGPAAAQTSQEEAERAAREIQAARDRANAAADAFFEAQSDLELLQDDDVNERIASAFEQTVFWIDADHVGVPHLFRPVGGDIYCVSSATELGSDRVIDTSLQSKAASGLSPGAAP